MTAASAERRAAHNRKYYAANGDKVRAGKVRAIARNKEYIARLKQEPCLDCGGVFPPVCMDFDHVGDDKDREIAKLVRAPVSLERLQAEVAKCELVCANCHRIRTQNRLAGVA